MLGAPSEIPLKAELDNSLNSTSILQNNNAGFWNNGISSMQIFKLERGYV
jgi:hypothetical protein